MLKFRAGKMADALSQFRYLPKVLGLIWDAAPRWTVAWALLLIVQGILPAAIVLLTRTVVDSLVLAIEANDTWSALQQAFGPIALMLLLMVATVVLNSFQAWIVAGQAELVQDHISRLMHQQALRLNLGFFETTKYYDLLERARTDSARQPVELLRNLGGMVQSSITLFSVAWILFTYGAWIPIVLVISTVPAFLVVLRYAREHNAWRERTTYERRRAQYYELLMTDQWAAGEMRLYDLGRHFQDAYQAIRAKLRGENLALIRKKGLAEFAAGILALLGSGAAMAAIVWRVLQGAATLGDLALFYQVFSRGQGLATLLLRSVGQIHSNLLFVANLFEFLALEPEIEEAVDARPMPVPLRHGITFHEVTFSYPNGQRPALDHFTLHIPAGKITAIVGANGAGKSTLTKLLARFYDPQEGHITIDGVDLREIDLAALRRQITMMFQIPVQYATTARENIALGDLHARASQEDIERAAKVSGADVPIARLPFGYDTMLSTWFGGVELSAGEWQRIAQARAFLRQANIVILDEPTSAMDSWTEAEWFDRFRKLVAGRTALIITHRFTTALQADIIHVMDQGRVIESGTHVELCALGGRYAESWQKQMRSTGIIEDGSLNNGHPVVA